jgi:anti-sigma factor RsiW
MNGDLCTFVDTWLDDWLAGRLPADVGHRIEAHVAVCNRCRRLVDVVRDAGATSDIEDEDADLLAPVLGRTTGSPCLQAEGLLPALVDSQLDEDTSDLLRDHVSHCDRCGRLLAVLEESRQVLPTLAELQAPPALAARVLAATSRRQARPPFAEWWLRVIARPRASLELAYVATVLIVAVLGNPVAAFEQARERAGRLAASAPVAQLSEQLPDAAEAVGTVGRVLNGLAAAANAVVDEVSARWRQVRSLLDTIEGAIADAVRWLASVDLAKVLRDVEHALQPRTEPASSGQPQRQ